MTGGIALSGGIDSAAAGLLLKQEKAALFGLFMRHAYEPVLPDEETAAALDSGLLDGLTVLIPGQDGFFVQKPWSPALFSLPADALSAVKVAHFLEIPLYLVDAASLFQTVVDDFVSNYLAAQTPNPCVLCNRLLKFGLLIQAARSLGCEFLATGHYVEAVSPSVWRSRQPDETVFPDWLAKTADDAPFLIQSPSAKDQTYVLWNLDRAALPFVRFPLARFTAKEEVRRFALDAGLTVSSGESQDICFIPNGTHAEFIHRYAGKQETAGDFVSESGEFLGKHTGYEKYTIGQRKGLGIGFGERIFVQRINAETRQVVLGPYESLAADRIQAASANRLADLPLNEEIRCEVKVRYRNKPAAAAVTFFEDGRLQARLDEPRYGVAPGQSLVCYRDGILLGGGLIESARLQSNGNSF